MCCDASSAILCNHFYLCFPWSDTLFNINKFTLSCCHRSFAAFLLDVSAIYQTLPNFHFAPLFVIIHTWVVREEYKVITTQLKRNPREVALWIYITIWPICLSHKRTDIGFLNFHSIIQSIWFVRSWSRKFQMYFFMFQYIVCKAKLSKTQWMHWSLPIPFSPITF